MAVEGMSGRSESFDVIVAGYGFAGAVSAIVAHDAGARVVILEKRNFPGGLSVVSGGGLAVTDDADEALAYLRRTCNGTTPDPVLSAMAVGMADLPEFIHSLEGRSDERIRDMRAVIDPDAHSTYPFPGGDRIRSMKVAPSETFDYFPWVQGLRGGARLFRLVYDNVVARGIEVRLGTPVVALRTGPGGVVTGVQTPAGAIDARRGVILACGGFEWNEELKRQYWPATPVYGITALGNTGDGIRLAQEVGADLWHMWLIHGSYGFKFPEYPVGFRHRIAGPRVPTRLMPWILVDKQARRFMNEYPPAPQDTAIRDLMVYDPDTQDYPRIPCWMIFDEVGRATGPIGHPIFVGDDIEPYEWSHDNLAEVERGWIRRWDDLGQLALALGLEPATLEATVQRWNQSCAQGKDARFGRLPGTMMPIATPPFYAVECWPVVSNTQGGPRHDERQRVLRPDGRPIPRLYAAGELGSLFGHLYLEAGNVAECFVAGRIAGGEAAQEPVQG